MIIREAALRQGQHPSLALHPIVPSTARLTFLSCAAGRRALAASAQRTWFRSAHTFESIAAALERHINDTHAIRSVLDVSVPKPKSQPSHTVESIEKALEKHIRDTHALETELFSYGPKPKSKAVQTIKSIEAALENHLKDTHAIRTELAAYIRGPLSQPVVQEPLASAAADSEIVAETVTEAVAENYHAFQHIQSSTAQLGTTLADAYRPHTLLTHPPSPSDITLELLLASQAHLGHSTSLWHPGNSRYIFGIRDGIHILDLSITAAHLRRACKVVRDVTYRGGLVLFVGTRPGQDRAVVNAAKLAQGCHLFERWIPGSITNGQQILGNCRLKLVDELDNEVNEPELTEQLSAKSVLKPDLVVCLNPRENYIMLHECGLNGIPTIGVVDTDQDPTWVTYPIPANDDSLRAIHVIAGVLGKAGQEGQTARREAAEQGRITFAPASGLSFERADEGFSSSSSPLPPSSSSSAAASAARA
ncbi:MAG: hypothetical protein M1819_000578 [Sarea resinae]|nr:MAG: hypothetical protein M1819_000578 [Sarea resinae]